jgi:glycosyltransferase involved in cell wall biosynthesis
MSANRLVSVVVPVYNGERTIAATVRSLLALDYPAECLELIVVDNGSSDGTAEILARFSDRIRVIHQPRRGRSQARNAGTAAARHSAIAFIDADCTASPGWLRHLVPRLEDPGVGIVGGKIVTARPCNAIEEFGERLHDHRQSIETYVPPYAMTGNWASPRGLLLEIGGFDEKIRRGEDCDLSYRMLQAGYRIVYEDSAVVSLRSRSTLGALFREGFQHGFYSVPLLAKHDAFVRGYCYASEPLHRYKQLARKMALTLRGKADEATCLATVFETGKRAGKICGSVRFGRLEL